MDQSYFPHWQERFSVGNPVLDGQHKRLLALCKEAIECMSDNGFESVPRFHSILNELAVYVEEHFRTEEAMLLRCGYPLAERHIAEHDEYEARLVEFLLAATMGEMNKEELHHYLSKWWYEHIMCSDKQYSAFLQRSEF